MSHAENFKGAVNSMLCEIQNLIRVKAPHLDICAWLRVSIKNYAALVDSIRLYGDTYNIYFKDNSIICLDSKFAKPTIFINNDLKNTYASWEPDLKEIIWETGVSNASSESCFQCEWRGAILIPCPEHANRNISL